MDTYIITPEGKQKPVRNLGWLLRKSSNTIADRIEVTKSKDPRNEAHVSVVFNDGYRFETDFMDKGMVADFFNKRRWRGVPVVWFGKKTKAGSIKESMRTKRTLKTEAAFKKVYLSMGDLVDIKKGSGQGEITKGIYDWFKKKFYAKASYNHSISSYARAKKNGKIEVSTPKLKIVLTPVGPNYVMVSKDDGVLGSRNDVEYYEVPNSAKKESVKTEAKDSDIKVGQWVVPNINTPQDLGYGIVLDGYLNDKNKPMAFVLWLNLPDGRDLGGWPAKYLDPMSGKELDKKALLKYRKKAEKTLSRRGEDTSWNLPFGKPINKAKPVKEAEDDGSDLESSDIYDLAMDLPSVASWKRMGAKVPKNPQWTNAIYHIIDEIESLDKATAKKQKSKWLKQIGREVEKAVKWWEKNNKVKVDRSLIGSVVNKIWTDAFDSIDEHKNDLGETNTVNSVRDIARAFYERTVGPAQKPLKESPPDKEAANELYLFITNDQQLYRSQHLSIIKNLTAKKAAGKYDQRLARKLFMYLVDAGAKKYQKEMGGSNLPWNKAFTKDTRLLTADMLAKDFEDSYEDGEYDDFIPKKYRKESLVFERPKTKKRRVQRRIKRSKAQRKKRKPGQSPRRGETPPYPKEIEIDFSVEANNGLPGGEAGSIVIKPPSGVLKYRPPDEPDEDGYWVVVNDSKLKKAIEKDVWKEYDFGDTPSGSTETVYTVGMWDNTNGLDILSKDGVYSPEYYFSTEVP